SLDLLLIDDIQFFAGKNRTQEEFFYAFEAMVAQRKQIIITSDTYPKELANIDSRLISRFDSGLTVAIEPPELEMRVAILLRKAQTEGITMPEEVAFFIAKHLRSNVRELEGALRKVSAYARFHGRDVLTVEVCKEALKDLLSVSNSLITVENIQKTVADFYKIKVADMYSKRRPANIALPRQIAMYLAKVLTRQQGPQVSFIANDLEVQITTHADFGAGAETQATTVAERKLLDILRALPDTGDVKLSLDDAKLSVHAGRSRFALQTLAADDYPTVSQPEQWDASFSMPQKALKHLFDRVHFSMAQQDI